MLRSTAFLIVSCLLLLFALPGCQDDPVSPADPTQPDQPTTREPNAASSHNCMGYHLLSIDVEGGTARMIPVRTTDWHFNLVGVLNNTMGVSAAIVPGESDPPNGLFVLDITLTHPFATKPQFSGFDVKGILITPGSLAVGSLIFADVDETCLENADGYTRWWNSVEFTMPGIFGYTQGNLAIGPASLLTATVNPFKLFADRLGPNDELAWVSDEPLDSDLGRAVFRAGNSNTRRYRIRFPMDPGPQVVYGYGIDASWTPPDPIPPGEVPDDFPIEANQPEAYRIGLIPTANSLYYDSESGTGGGVLRFQVNVHDWQGQVAGDIAGEISTVRIFAPDLMSGGVDGVFLNETPIKARYTADLMGLTNPTESGDVKIICRVGSTDGSTYKQAGAPAPDEPLSAFHAITLDIPDPECTTDTSDDFSESIALSLDEPTVDQLCAPDDYRDFFSFDLPLGHEISGSITLYCDPEPTKFALFAESLAGITEISVSGGSATLDLDALGVMPGSYYIRVLTQTSGQAFLYMIDPDLEFVDLTPNAVDVTPDDLYFRPTLVQGYGYLAIAYGDDRIWFIDYSQDLYDPELLSILDIPMHGKPAFTYPYIYCSDGESPSSISMIDISDPVNPIVYEHICTASGLVGVLTAEPDYLYLGNQLGAIDIFDISTDPADPLPAGVFYHTTTPFEMELIYEGPGPDTWLAICESSNVISYYDVTIKSAATGPLPINWPGGYQIRDLATIDNYCFGIMYPGGSSWYLVSTCIESGAPVYKNNIGIVYGAFVLDVEEDHAFAMSVDGLSRSDISDPDNPASPDNYSFNDADISDMDVEGDHIYHACGIAGLRYTTTGPANYGRMVGLAQPMGMTADGDYLYVPEYGGPYMAVKSVDISDPSTAFVADEVLIDHTAWLVAVRNGKMVTAGFGNYMQAVDCSDPTNMVAHSDYDTFKQIRSLAMNDYALYVGHTDSSFDVWDISGWPTIAYSSFVSMPDVPWSLIIKGDFLYAMAGGMIFVYSIIDPLNPTSTDAYIPLAPATKITINGDYLYIATTGSLEITDISEPSTLYFVASEPHPDAPNGEYVAVENQFAILQPYWTTPPTVMRVWPPDDPTVIGPLYDTSYEVKPNQVLIHDGYYYERVPDPPVRIWSLH